MALAVDSHSLPESAARMSLLSHDGSGDDVIGLGVPHDDGDAESEYAMQEEDLLMTEKIMKLRSDLQRIVERTIPLAGDNLSGNGGGSGDAQRDNAHDLFGSDHHDNSQNIPPHSASHGDRDDATGFDAGFRTPQATTSRPLSGERLMQLSRTERTDRMKLAELSDVRNEKLSREAILRWNPHAKLAQERETHTFKVEKTTRRNGKATGGGAAAAAPRERMAPTTPRTTAKMLGKYSKDYVQQALDFNNPDLMGDDDHDNETDVHADDGEESDEEDDDLSYPSPGNMRELLKRQPVDQQPTREVKKFMKHMQATITELEHQRADVLRNQAEFDRHASGMFPTLETLNNQLSQIVQERMLQSQVNIKDDLDGELRHVRVRLNELEADAKNRRNDAELHEQRRQLDIAQIKGEIASVSTSGSLQNQKLELLSSQVKRLQQEAHEFMEVNQSLTKQYQFIDQRITTLQVAVKEKRFATSTAPETEKSLLSRPWVALLVVVVAVSLALAVVAGGDRCSWLFGGRCHPLT